MTSLLHAYPLKWSTGQNTAIAYHAVGDNVPCPHRRACVECSSPAEPGREPGKKVILASTTLYHTPRPTSPWSPSPYYVTNALWWGTFSHIWSYTGQGVHLLVLCQPEWIGQYHAVTILELNWKQSHGANSFPGVVDRVPNFSAGEAYQPVTCISRFVGRGCNHFFGSIPGMLV